MPVEPKWEVPRLNTEVFYILVIVLAIFSQLPSMSQTSPAQVKRNTFTSSENPSLVLNVDEHFKYLGSLPFTIERVAAGYRYIFVQFDSAKRVQKMFVIQQEGFLPSANDTYKYKITNPAKLGHFDYLHTVILDDNPARIREEPDKEAAATQRFLSNHGYRQEPELVMARFARPVDGARRHEIIFFCFENLASYGHKLSDFANGANADEKEAIKAQVDENCRASFEVRD